MRLETINVKQSNADEEEGGAAASVGGGFGVFCVVGESRDSLFRAGLLYSSGKSGSSGLSVCKSEVRLSSSE